MTVHEVMLELQKRGISWQSVAETTGLSRGAMHKWYRNEGIRPHASSVRLLCKYYPLEATFDEDGNVDFTFNEDYSDIEQMMDLMRDFPPEYLKIEAMMASPEEREAYSRKVDVIRSVLRKLIRYPLSNIISLDEILKEPDL